MNVRKIYMILFSALCFCLSLSAQDAQDSTDIVAPVSGHEFATGTNTVYSKAAADSAYMENKYLDAVYMYEALLAENGESAELRYNLGNSYYKANNIAKAILNYEKALLLAPADDDIKANLEIAKSKTVDKEEAESEFFISPLPSGRPKCEITTTFAPLFFSNLMVGTVRTIRASFVT